MTGTLRQWLSIAEGDYLNALDLKASGRESAYAGICFSSQQCVEKLMKAVLVLNQQEVPKEHDLRKLHRSIQSYITLQVEEMQLTVLTTGAVEFRYPGDEPTREEAEYSLKTCEAIQEQLLPLFKER